MKTLYDLLGAHPDDDAEGLRNAFRKAAKANHPDLHAGDQDAPMRFRQIVEAYDILRDAEQRATYDHRLAFEREQLLSKSKRSISYFIYIAFDAVVVVGLASVLAGGYTIFTQIPKASVQLVAITTHGPAKMDAVQPTAQPDPIEPNELRDKLGRVPVTDMAIVPSVVPLAADDGGTQQVARGGPTPGSAGLNTEVAKPNTAFDLQIDQAAAKTDANHLEKNYGIGAVYQNKVQSTEVRFSSPEKNNGVLKSSSSNFAISSDKDDMKIPNSASINIGDMKIPGRPRTVVKRQIASRTPFKQASLENRSTSGCSGYRSCPRDLPPLFGVGF
ncbi:MAG TPA: J domain-containing protein [Xanthobacteraceae bacterium]|nr:J domain-containing protein [Xanthobacteraceae bacterium]